MEGFGETGLCELIFLSANCSNCLESSIPLLVKLIHMYLYFFFGLEVIQDALLWQGGGEVRFAFSDFTPTHPVFFSILNLGGFMLSCLVKIFLLDINKWLSFIRDMELLPRLFGANFSNLWTQSFEWNLTILPKIRIWNWLMIFYDPDEERMAQFLADGEHAVWPTIPAVSNRMRIEQAIGHYLVLSRNDASAVSFSRWSMLTNPIGRDFPFFHPIQIKTIIFEMARESAKDNKKPRSRTKTESGSSTEDECSLSLKSPTRLRRILNDTHQTSTVFHIIRFPLLASSSFDWFC